MDISKMLLTQNKIARRCAFTENVFKIQTTSLVACAFPVIVEPHVTLRLQNVRLVLVRMAVYAANLL